MRRSDALSLSLRSDALPFSLVLMLFLSLTGVGLSWHGKGEEGPAPGLVQASCLPRVHHHLPAGDSGRQDAQEEEVEVSRCYEPGESSAEISSSKL